MAPSTETGWFGSFVVQARSERTGGGLQVTGVVENLATGERTRFTTPQDLSRLIERWAQSRLDGGTP